MTKAEGRWYFGQHSGDVVPPGRGGHCACTIGSKIYVFGGADRMPTPFDDIWVVDTEADLYAWTRLTPPYAPEHDVLSRSGATITPLGDKLFVIGGQDPLTGLMYTDVVVFDLASLEWKKADMSNQGPPARHSHTAVPVGPSAILVYGGAGYDGPLGDVWILNTVNWEWTRPTVQGQAPPAREMHAALMLDDTRVLIYGGRSAENAVLNDLCVLDVQKMAWVDRKECAFSRCSHTALFLNHSQQEDGRMDDGSAGQVADEILVFGGWTGEEVSGDVLHINPSTLQVSMRLPGPRPEEVAALEQKAQAAAAAAHASKAAANGNGAAASEVGAGAGAGTVEEKTPEVQLRESNEGAKRDSPPGEPSSRSTAPMEVDEGPSRASAPATVPVPKYIKPRFAHVGAVVPDPAGDTKMMVVFGGVTASEDLRDICVYRYTEGAAREVVEQAREDFEAASALLNLL